MKRLLNSPHRLWMILVGALILRLAFVLIIDPGLHTDKGDTFWLLKDGRELVSNTLVQSPQSGPVYLVYAGVLQTIFWPAAAETVLRILNAVMGTALCAFVFILGKRYFDERIGLLAALVMAINPAFIIESGNVMTESPFLFLLFGAFALYATRQDQRSWRDQALVGVLLGLATLTRAVTLLIPFVLVIHLLYLWRRQAIRLIGALLLTYALTISTWTVYNLYRWHQWVIGAQGLLANVYLGTTNWCGPECTDQQAHITPGSDNQTVYVNDTLHAILNDPIGYIRHRFANLFESYLQPYNTVYYPGQSIKQAVADWWANGHQVSDLWAITQIQAFWPKLVLYLFHYIALFFGLIGLLLGLLRLGPRLPMYGLIGYFTALHLVLTAIPRYLFPTEPVWWLFAAYTLISIGSRLRLTQRQPQTEQVRQFA